MELLWASNNFRDELVSFSAGSRDIAPSDLTRHQNLGFVNNKSSKPGPMSVNPLDWNDWDDTVLLQDWDQAFAEYEVRCSNSHLKEMLTGNSQKYHSISQSGKSLEEALTKEELEQLGNELRR